jgi:hypothetical protein
VSTHPPRLRRHDISLEAALAWGSLCLLMLVGTLLILQPA